MNPIKEILYRPVRRYLQESINEVVVIKQISELLSLLGDVCIFDVEYVDEGIDKRIGWHTYLVCVKGKAAGYVNFPIQPIEDKQIPISKV